YYVLGYVGGDEYGVWYWYGVGGVGIVCVVLLLVCWVVVVDRMFVVGGIVVKSGVDWWWDVVGDVCVGVVFYCGVGEC
ncbi:hypothetical protein DF186_14345, partial [Enterococcus hirae]